MKAVEFHPAAIEELDTASMMYGDIDDELEERFQSRLNEIVNTVGRTPKRFVYEPEFDCREAVMMEFPYTVYYREYEDAVWIVACAHQRRRPGYWKDRLSDLPTTD